MVARWSARSAPSAAPCLRASPRRRARTSRGASGAAAAAAAGLPRSSMGSLRSFWSTTPRPGFGRSPPSAPAWRRCPRPACGPSARRARRSSAWTSCWARPRTPGRWGRRSRRRWAGEDTPCAGSSSPPPISATWCRLRTGSPSRALLRGCLKSSSRATSGEAALVRPSPSTWTPRTSRTSLRPRLWASRRARSTRSARRCGLIALSPSASRRTGARLRCWPCRCRVRRRSCMRRPIWRMMMLQAS
mmetsp:Transcript_131239/g.331406  ORF Transcript_131239/g.331406 Transcript_131239/m.331406 type:complete len:246 (+) Transcript_131239:360-1097(+)